MSPSSTDHAAPKPFLTTQEVSDLLRISVYTVRRWINEGKLPAYKVGRLWRVKKGDLDDWLNEQQSQTND